MQVIVVGGGAQGLAIAVELARHGHLVQLLERERPGQRSSWVAAGLLTASSPWKYPPALVGLCHASEPLYDDWFTSLRLHTGIDSEYEVAGMLHPEGVDYDAAQIAEHSRLRRALGFAVEHLDRRALDRLQPGLGPDVTGAAFQPAAARVRPPRYLRALVRRADQLGVHVVSGCDVRRLLCAGGRVLGVVTAREQPLHADAVVLATGAWASALAATAGVSIDVRPVRGQILLLAGPPGLLGPTVNDGECYLVPRRDGRILVGSTMEDAGFAAYTTGRALARLRRLAARLLPATADLSEEMAWAGLRPGTPDRLPYIGEVPGVPGLLLAAGHFRNGILLSPITARLIAAVLAGAPTEVDLSPFAPRPVDPEAVLMTS